MTVRIGNIPDDDQVVQGLKIHLSTVLKDNDMELLSTNVHREIKSATQN